ncbi:FAD-binding oxidoreductase [Synechococcus sp. PCC 7336]|uniref:FAD-binding oxidoreductase n=1 Tax=Synechococcus sp. PCC 7336 TaxID=195250 RepID=UPI00034BBCE7|nr:FAD-binding oxidoreductase [Synechococcus sp. PCC 7336]
MAIPPAFLKDLRSVVSAEAILTDAGVCERLSKDYFWYSPWLIEELSDKQADAVVQCSSEAEAIDVLRLAHRHRVPVVARGLGTGNYGQAIPLQGGIVLDLKPMDRILGFENGGVRVEAGVKLLDIEQAGRECGLELRMYPSTIAMSTIGGFIAGGSCGIGSINHGVLRDRGNVRSLRVVTANEEPQVLELKGKEIDKVLHAYGTNSIITEIDLPLTHRTDWIQMAVAFESLQAAHNFCWALGRSEGIHKREIALLEQPLIAYQKVLANVADPDKHTVLLLVDPTDANETRLLVQDFDGGVTAEIPLYEPGAPTLSDATWNHTTLWAKKYNENFTYLQCAFAADPQKSWEQSSQLKEKFGEDWSIHVEMVRFMGAVNYWSLPVLRYRDREQLQGMMDECFAIGVGISNPHTFILEEGGHDAGNPVQLAFKYEADPLGILNPGKMKLFVPPEDSATEAVSSEQESSDAPAPAESASELEGDRSPETSQSG